MRSVDCAIFTTLLLCAQLIDDSDVFLLLKTSLLIKQVFFFFFLDITKVQKYQNLHLFLLFHCFFVVLSLYIKQVFFFFDITKVQKCQNVDLVFWVIFCLFFCLSFFGSFCFVGAILTVCFCLLLNWIGFGLFNCWFSVNCRFFLN